MTGNTWKVDSHGKLESKCRFFLPYMEPKIRKKPHKNPLILGPPKKWVVHFGSELDPPKNRHSRPFACSRRSVRHLAKTPSDLGRPVMILISVLVESFLVEKKEGTSSGEKIVQTKIQAISIG